MKKGLEIRKIAQKRIDNARHLQFHRSVYDLLVEFELEKLGVPEDLKVDYSESLDVELELNMETTANIHSELLQKKNAERNQLVLFIFGEMRNHLRSPEKDEAEAAQRLAITIKPYIGIQKKSFDRETADLSSLITDLEKPENKADVAKLGLTKSVQKLEKLNAEFSEIYLQRTKERAAKKMPASIVVRAETDTIYERIILTLQSNYIYGKDPIDPEQIATLVERINKRADEIDTEYRRRLSLRKAAAERRKRNPKPTKPSRRAKKGGNSTMEASDAAAQTASTNYDSETTLPMGGDWPEE